MGQRGRPLFPLFAITLAALTAALGFAVVSACSSDPELTPATNAGGGGDTGPKLSVSPTDCEAGFVLAPAEKRTLKVTVKDAAGALAKGQEVLFLAPDGPGVASGTFEPADASGPRYGRAKTGDDGVASITFVAADVGTFLVDALPVGAEGGATFGITVNANGARPGASMKDARCRFEGELLAPAAEIRAEQLLHGPVFVPAGTKVQPADAPDKAVELPNPSLVFWVDDMRFAKFQHPTRFIVVDAQNPSAAPNVVAARYWPEIVLPGGAPSALTSPWRTSPTVHGSKAVALKTTSFDPSNTLRTRTPGAIPVAGAPGEKVCAVVFYGEPDEYLHNDADNMRNFYVNELKIPVFAKTDGAGKLVQPTLADLAPLLAAAKASGCTKIILYISSHGGGGGLDKVRRTPTAQKADVGYEELADVIKAGVGTGVTLSMINDACYGATAIEFLQRMGLDGEYVTAADKDNQSAASNGWFFSGIGATSYFSDSLRACWADPESDTDNDGRITLAEAFQCSKTKGNHHVTRPNPNMTALLKDGRAFSPPIPPVSIPCPGVEVKVTINPPRPLTERGIGVVEVTDSNIATSPVSFTLFDLTNGGKATLPLAGVAPGQTTYKVSVYVEPYVYSSTGVLTVGPASACADAGAGVDAGPDGGPTEDAGPPDPCALPNASKVVLGKQIYRVPMGIGCNGHLVCAAAKKTCIGVPVLSPASAACTAFHPATQVKSDVNGWKQSIYCDGTAGGLGCNGELQCHDCPLCNSTGLGCDDSVSSLLTELYAECQ